MKVVKNLHIDTTKIKKRQPSSPNVPELSYERLKKGIPLINKHFLNKYKIVKFLGSGSYGVAMKCMEEFTGIEHCIKVTPYECEKERNIKNISSLRLACHVFLVLRLSTLFIQNFFGKDSKSIIKEINNKKEKYEKINCLMRFYLKKIENNKKIIIESELSDNSKEILKLIQNKFMDLDIVKIVESKVQKELICSIREKSFLDDFNDLTNELFIKKNNTLKNCFREAQKIAILQTEKENFLTLYYTWIEKSPNLHFLFQKTKLYNDDLNSSISTLENDCREHVMFCLVRGIRTMHKNKLVHLDIKRDNILVEISNKKVLDVAICDFGSLSSFYNNKKIAENFEQGKQLDKNAIKKVAESLLKHWKLENGEKDKKKSDFIENLTENSLKEDFLEKFEELFPMKSKLQLEQRSIVDHFEKKMNEMEERFKIKLEEKDDEIKSLKGKMKERDDQIQSLKEKMKERDDEIRSLKENMGKKDDQIRTLNKKMKEKDYQINTLNNGMNELKDIVNALKMEINKMKSQQKTEKENN